MGQVNFFQSCLPQILLDSFLNTFSHKNFYRFHSVSFKIRHFYRFYSFCCWVAIMENILQTQTRIISAYIYPTLPFLQFLHYFRRYRFCISHSFIFYHWPTSYIKSLKSSHEIPGPILEKFYSCLNNVASVLDPWICLSIYNSTTV